MTQSVIMDLKEFINRAIPFAYISDGNSATTGVNIKLNDTSGNTLPNSGAVASGTYRPSHGITGPSGITAVRQPHHGPAGAHHFEEPHRQLCPGPHQRRVKIGLESRRVLQLS